MDVTKKLIELNPEFVLHNEGAWSEPLDETKSGYTSFNDAGIETETGEFLYSMARILKPLHILETGTHFGVGASYMGMACKNNNYGEVHTIEFLPEIYQKAKKNIELLGLSEWVGMHLMNASDYLPLEETYKLILLDTEPQTRFAELIKFYPFLEEGGFIFIHDLHQHMHQIPNEEHGFAWPYGKLPDEIIDLVVKDKLRPMHFATPRGLTGFYKPHLNDFNFTREMLRRNK